MKYNHRGIMENIKIRKLEKNDWGAVLEIVKKLHSWFDSVALTFEIPNDLKFHQGMVAEVNGKIVGFLTYSSFEGEVYVSWIGVDPDYHRQGIGRILMSELEKTLKEQGIDKLKVETLSANIKYEPYEKTRAFYKKLGFVDAETRNFISRVSNEELEMVSLRKNI